MKPPKYPLFNKGDIVKEKTGSRNMTVSQYTNKMDSDLKKIYDTVVCVWNENGKKCDGQFPEKDLELVKGIVVDR